MGRTSPLGIQRGELPVEIIPVDLMGEQVQGVLGIELLGQGRCEKTRLGSGLGFWSRLTSFVPVSYGNLVNHTMFLMVFLNIICYISVVYVVVKGRLNKTYTKRGHVFKMAFFSDFTWQKHTF